MHLPYFLRRHTPVCSRLCHARSNRPLDRNGWIITHPLCVRAKIREKAGQAIRLLGAYLTVGAVLCVRCLQDGVVFCAFAYGEGTVEHAVGLLTNIRITYKSPMNHLRLIACSPHVCRLFAERSRHEKAVNRLGLPLVICSCRMG